MLEWLSEDEETKTEDIIVCSETSCTVVNTEIMESSELRRRRIKQSRRKERAEKVEKERTTSNDPDDDNLGPPVKKPRKKPRKPIAEEDIVDGFAILAFKNYEDLTVIFYQNFQNLTISSMCHHHHQHMLEPNVESLQMNSSALKWIFWQRSFGYSDQDDDDDDVCIYLQQYLSTSVYMYRFRGPHVGFFASSLFSLLLSRNLT